MRHLNLTCGYECKATGEDSTHAYFSGVASTSDVDQHNDVIVSGAFDPIPLNDAGEPAVGLYRGHDSNEVIGGWKKFTQTKTQLKVDGALLMSVQRARETYDLMKAGYLTGLSVGFRITTGGASYDEKSGRRTITKARLMECSIVSSPANTKARIRDVKAEGGLSEETLNDWLAENGFSDHEISVAMTKGLSSLIEARRKPLTFEKVDEEELPDEMLGPEPTRAELAELFKEDLAKPYGDVAYADPGYRGDRKRYPIDTEGHIRAAWNYIHQASNRRFYTAAQLSAIEGRIIAAWKRKIDPEGPPGAKADLKSEIAAMMRELQKGHSYV